MRIWSLHPKYLDSKGLVALWRETLLAQKVLAGKTQGYRHHPQLIRFKETRDPLLSIGLYLDSVAQEAQKRGYRFDRRKILKLPKNRFKLKVTRGQVDYEGQHLLKKLARRSPALYQKWVKTSQFDVHPLFRRIAGEIEEWENLDASST